MNQNLIQKRNITLLGSTGSIGINSLEVIKNHKDNFKILGLAAGNNIDLLREQIKKFEPIAVSVKNKEDACQLKRENLNCSIYFGEEGLREIVSLDFLNTVISAIPGTTTLGATFEAISRGHRICLANKETMVAAGDIINKHLKSSDAQIIPVDSEHSAIFQSLANNHSDSVKRVILTASGGPFFKIDKEHFKDIKLNDALKHPTWNMGKKITIDSATMMNKALEMIEAQKLFHLAEDQIDVLIHPQSIVHSMVEYIDSSVIAQMGLPDMKLPIYYSLTYPTRGLTSFTSLDLSKISQLEFYQPDEDKFKSIKMARYVLKEKKNSGAVFNASNEEAVDAFLNNKIGFDQIFEIVGSILYNTKLFHINSLDEVKETVLETKEKTKSLIKEGI